MKHIEIGVLILALIGAGNVYALGPEIFQYAKDNEVLIGYACIGVPVGKIAVIRNKNTYFGVKFLRTWKNVDNTETYSEYETYHSPDYSGDFTTSSIMTERQQSSSLPLTGPFRPFIWNPGRPFIKCGKHRLVWIYKTGICLIPPSGPRKDYGYEIAPTKADEITTINAYDNNIIYYRFIENENRKILPLDNVYAPNKRLNPTAAQP